MIATIRTNAEYYQQTAVTLMYASRAKKVRNRSLVNKNVLGDTGIHAVTKEVMYAYFKMQLCINFYIYVHLYIDKNVLGDTGIHAVTKEVIYTYVF
jgi:hypothetical protein